MLLFGGLLITALYNLCLFILNLNERPAAFFAVLTLSMAARTLLTGQRIINLWFPSTDWNISFMILFVLGALVLASFILFLNSLFRNQFNPAAVRISLSLCGILIVLPFAVPAEHLRFADLFFFGISLLFFIYTIYVLIIAVRKKMQGAVFAFAGIIFVICTILLDMAFPPGSNIIPIGVFIFIIFQSLVVGKRHSQAVEQNRMLHNVAVRDGMTNLYKKDHFRKLIASAIADGDSSRQHALLFIDIDDFKTVNDTYGHDSGDRLLIAFAERLLTSLRHSDIASRYGGDEFTVWLHNTSIEESELVAQRILQKSAEPVTAGEHQIPLKLSIGISYYPDDADSPDRLFEVCDRRMYEAKRQGKNRFYSGQRRS